MPEEIFFTDPVNTRSGHMCTDAGEPMKQTDALLDALATNNAQYAPSGAETENCPLCITPPLPTLLALWKLSFLINTA